tara:strand:+ start:4002 stop:4850 length:849 start_codon:yes stop_codon:yes gene_type:complete
MKKLENLVSDIYSVLSPLTEGEALDISDKDIDDFGEAIKDVVRHWATPKARDSNTLRMSNIGKPSRQLWYDLKYKREESSFEDSHLPIKFLYGHLLEEVLLFLVKMSGHKVEDEQKEVEVKGVKGHIDCKIDGEVIDIKTASGFAFNKFRNGTLREDDPFGYMAQLAGYEEAEGTTNGGFLVINKESGELTLYQPEELDKPYAPKIIEDIKESLNNNEPPEVCYEPIPEGKSGNMKLPKNCVYCNHKFKCYPDLRVFKYSKGLVYFTEIVNEPKVEEVLNVS